jgi:uncharacterized membrane protein
MTASTLTALHHVIALLLVATLAVELTLVSKDMTPRALRVLARVHPLYLALFAAMIAAGLLRAALSTEGLRHYAADPVFVLKMVALTLALLTNIPTSRAFTRWRRLSSDVPGALPRAWEIRHARHWMHAGAIAFVAVPMLGAFVGGALG